MSLHDRTAAEVLTQLVMAGDGTYMGIGIAYIAYRTIRKYMAMSSALQKIRLAAEVHPSDLQSILLGNEDDRHVSNSNYEGEQLVVVRGVVELKSHIEKWNWKSFRGTNLLISEISGEKCVILQQSKTYIYNGWGGVFGWTKDLRSRLLRASNEQESSFMRRFIYYGGRDVFDWTADLRSRLFRASNDQGSSCTRMVPFVLVEAGNFSLSDFVVVNMEGSKHPLPLKTYQYLQHFSATPYNILQALFSPEKEYPIGRLYKEKILPLGKNITAVGICHLKDGTPEIKSCKDLPFFLSDLTKDQMVADLSLKSKLVMLGGVILGSIALGMLCYSIPRNWIRWRRVKALATSSSSDEESGDVPEGELCVICLMRRRRYAFVRCGHLICCQRCAFKLQRTRSPMCPVCRQRIQASIRIYDS